MSLLIITLYILQPSLGIEPRTSALQVQCSTTKLKRHNVGRKKDTYMIQRTRISLIVVTISSLLIKGLIRVTPHKIVIFFARLLNGYLFILFNSPYYIYNLSLSCFFHILINIYSKIIINLKYLSNSLDLTLLKPFQMWIQHVLKIVEVTKYGSIFAAGLLSSKYPQLSFTT